MSNDRKMRIIKKGSWNPDESEPARPLQLQDFTEGRIPKQFVADTTQESEVGLPAADLKHVRIIRSAQANHIAKQVDVETSFTGRKAGLDLLEESFLEDLFFEGNPEVENPDAEIDDTGTIEENVVEAPPLTIEEQKEVWLAEWNAEQVEVVKAAEAEAYQKGFDAAVESEAQKLREAQASFEQGLTFLQEDWSRFLRESEPILGQFAFKIAELIIESPISDKVRQVSREMLFEAIHELGTTHVLDVRVHPVDFLAMQEAGIADSESGSFELIRWESDPELAPGEWTATSFQGAVRRVMAERIDNLRQQFGFDLYDDE